MSADKTCTATFKARHGKDNPNVGLIRDLTQAGVEFRACGQGLLAREIDNSTGYRFTPFCPPATRDFEWFIPGTEPQEYCPIHPPFRTGITRHEPTAGYSRMKSGKTGY